MTTITSIPIPQEDKKIIELLSVGHNHDEVRDHLQGHYPIDLSGKKLGYKISEIRRKSGCHSQIELGYRFAREEFGHTIRAINARHQAEIVKAKMEKYQEAYKDAYESASLKLTGEDHNKGLMIGVTAATLFWLIIYAIITFS